MSGARSEARRYEILTRSSQYQVYCTLHPKPITQGDWNGAGMHTNMSTKKMREAGGLGEFVRVLAIENNNKLDDEILYILLCHLTTATSTGDRKRRALKRDQSDHDVSRIMRLRAPLPSPLTFHSVNCKI